jgi:hypothetical protein
MGYKYYIGVKNAKELLSLVGNYEVLHFSQASKYLKTNFWWNLVFISSLFLLELD